MTIDWLNYFRRPGIWRCIFLRSVVNGAAYDPERLERSNWDWPKDTYLRRRLKYLKSPLYPERDLDRPTVKIYSLASKMPKEVPAGGSKKSLAGHRNGPKRVRTVKRIVTRSRVP